MKRNIKLFNIINDLKWWKFWVRGSLCFSGMGWLKSNAKSLSTTTKQLSIKLQNPL